SASMALLSAILLDAELKHLHVLGAYRDNEVDEGHAVHALEKAMADSGRMGSRIALKPLGMEALSAMVADMLAREASDIEELAVMTQAKTDGSPFFVEQFLRALHEQRLLSRDAETGAWRWDAAQIERAGVTDNVATLLTQKLGRLSSKARR